MKRDLISFGLAAAMLATSSLSIGRSPATPEPGVPSTTTGLIRQADDSLWAQANTGAEMADGEIRKVDKENQRLTVKHGEIKNLEMPPMTMVFLIKDQALLEQLKPGDKIKFRAVSEGGKFTITEVQRTP